MAKELKLGYETARQQDAVDSSDEDNKKQVLQQALSSDSEFRSTAKSGNRKQKAALVNALVHEVIDN